MNDTLIDIRGLKKYYPVKGGLLRKHIADVKAVDEINLKIKRGECLGLVGESGCGKTTLGKTLLNIHKATEGRVYFDQNETEVEVLEKLIAEDKPEDTSKVKQMRSKMDMTKYSSKMIANLRRRMQIVFQDPTDSLDPRMLVKKIVAEPLECQKLLNPTEIQERLQQIMETVGLSKQHYNRYPHEFSGGQRQRIAVARALTTHPDLILMDEPTSALDVSVQSQILNLLKGLQKQFNLTYIFVTHHLLVVKFISDRIAVMYLGKIVEIGKTKTVFENAKHPYTRALLSAIPVPDPEIEKERIVLEGDVPNPINPPNGCRFHPRCQYAADICKKELPVMESIDETDHSVACHRWKEIY